MLVQQHVTCMSCKTAKYVDVQKIYADSGLCIKQQELSPVIAKYMSMTLICQELCILVVKIGRLIPAGILICKT